MIKEIIKSLKKYYFPILYLLFFIEISSFAENLFNGLGLSFVVSTILILIFICRIRIIPKNIIIGFMMLTAYTILMSLIGEDWKNCIITLGNVAALFLLIKSDISMKDWEKSFIYTGIIGIIILYLYDNKLFLVNWNSNTIGMFSCFGIMSFIISYKIARKKMIKIINIFFMIIALLLLLTTDNRNALMIFFIALIGTLLINVDKIKNARIKIYSIISIVAPAFITLGINKISKLSIIEYLTNYSEKIFGKSTLLSGREEIWAICEEYIGNSWLFGKGESLYNYMYAHNMFYSVVYFVGIIGYILYGILMYTVFKFIITKAKENKDIISYCCLMIFLAIFFGQIMENVLFTSNYNIFIPYLFLSVSIGRGINGKVNK